MEQIELNKKLFSAITSGKIDLKYIENLLQLGADPLGSANEDDSNEHILEEIFCAATDISDNMPNIVQLFYNYGMSLEKIKNIIREIRLIN